MKKLKLIQICIIAILSIIVVLSCKKENPRSGGTTQLIDKKWITVYKNVILGSYENATYESFFKLNTGDVVALNNVTTDIQKYITILYYENPQGKYLTFPANAKKSWVPGEPDISTFIDDPHGLNYWTQSNMNSGVISSPIAVSNVEFDELSSNPSPEKFGTMFKQKNSDKEFLTSSVGYTFNPVAGEVYLV